MRKCIAAACSILAILLLLASEAIPAGIDTEAWRVLRAAMNTGGVAAEAAFAVLGTIDDAESRRLIESLLKSESDWAGAAARGLDATECVLYLPLLKGLALSPTFKGKPWVLSAIAKAGTPGAAEVLREVADAGVQPETGLAFGLLESMGATAAGRALIDEAATGSEPRQRETAIYVLGGMQLPGVISAFRAALSDRDQRVRLAAALGLGRRGALDGRAEIETAAQSLNENDRIEAIVTLVKLGLPGWAERLKALVSAPNQAVAARTVWAIAGTGGSRLREFSYAQGLPARPAFRPLLAEKLLDPSDPRDLALLTEMLSDNDEATRLIAAGRLLKTRFSEKARAVIAQGLASGSDATRALALDEASNSAALQGTLAQLTGSGDPFVREAAIAAVGSSGQRDKFALLEAALRDPVPAVSLAAAKALASLDAASARPLLIRGLASDVAHVRMNCAALLLRIDGKASAAGP